MYFPARVWPTWLPKAVATAESRLSSLNATLSPAVFQPPLPPLVFSATFGNLQSASSFQQACTPTTLTPARRPRRDLRAYSTTTRPLQLHTLREESRRLQAESTRIRTFTTSPVSPPPLYNEIESHSDASPPLQRSWTPPTASSAFSRPVTIIGSGVLGRRLAVLWASTSRPVNLYDTSPSALSSSVSYVADSLVKSCAENGTSPGKVHFTTSLIDACKNSWMVIECVPEDLDLKISVLGRIDRTAPLDCIIATNSASFRSRELVSEVRHRERVLNTLYYIPPANKCVELMSCGYTSPHLMPFLTTEMRTLGLTPFPVRTESLGLIFPRLFGTMKREVLKILQEKVATPSDIDALFCDFFGAAKGPCRKMDEVGLDTVARTEEHFLNDRYGELEAEGWRGVEGDSPGTHDYLEWLRTEYIEKGKLGEKSGEGLVVKKKENNAEKKHGDVEEVWKDHSLDLSGM